MEPRKVLVVGGQEGGVALGFHTHFAGGGGGGRLRGPNLPGTSRRPQRYRHGFLPFAEVNFYLDPQTAPNNGHHQP